MRYRAIQEHDRRYPIRLMCRALMVSPACYYALAGRPESNRSVHNRALLSAIRVIHRKSRETYGQSQHLGRPDQAGTRCRRASHRAAHARRRNPGQDREEVACHDRLGPHVAGGHQSNRATSVFKQVSVLTFVDQREASASRGHE